MKEIGNIFLEKREEIGITIAEVSKDLAISEVLIENLEEGNFKAFKDVLELKNVALSLAKYLGIDEEEINDLINDYIFEKTSKISLEDIQSRMVLEPENKIKSPYTILPKDKTNKSFIIIFVVILLFLIIMYYILRYVLL